VKKLVFLMVVFCLLILMPSIAFAQTTVSACRTALVPGHEVCISTGGPGLAFRFVAGEYPTISDQAKNGTSIFVNVSYKAALFSDVNFTGACTIIKPDNNPDNINNSFPPNISGQAIASIIVVSRDTPDANLRCTQLTGSPLPLIQAESGTFAGGAASSDIHSGFDATGFAAYLTAEKSSVLLNANVTSAGIYDLNIRYAAGPHGPESDRTISLYVNGNLIRQLSFERTGSWASWANQNTDVALNAGNNTIEFRYDSGDTGYINIDYIGNLSASTSAPSAPVAQPASVQATAMLALVNQFRSQPQTCGGVSKPAVPALTLNDQLNQAAQLHSEDMANNNYFDHDGLNGSSPWNRIAATGYQVGGAQAENISAGRATAQEAFDGWVASPGHCSNMMSPDVTQLGVGYGQNTASQFTHYWTQVFAHPQ
jgi:uncharacterized protein YkwD